MSDELSFPDTIRIGILVYDGFEPIDVWGFTEAFAVSRFIGTGYQSPAPYPFEVKLISNEMSFDGCPKLPSRVKSANGPFVSPDFYRDDAVSENFDLLMIPGGMTAPLLDQTKPKEVEALIEWVREMDKGVRLMTSVCTGAAILASAGLLDGLHAATNHQGFAWVTQFGPKVLWDNVSRWVDSGKYVTSAGVSSGTDMGFYLVERLAGRAVAEVAAKTAEYDWHRDPQEPIYYPQQAKVPSSG